MEFYIQIGGAVLLFFVSLPFWIGPFIVHATQKMQAHPTIEPAVLEDFPEESQIFFTKNFPLLQQLDFQSVAFFKIPDLLPNLKNLVALWINRKTQELAILTDVHIRNEKMDLHQFYIEFCTTFTNHSEISTNNTQELVEHYHPNKEVFIFPQLENPIQLYSVHQHLVQKYRSTRQTCVPLAGQEMEEFRNNLVEDLGYLPSKGYWAYDAENDIYRITWKGAFLLTWRLAWPVGAIRKWSQRQEAKRLLKSLDILFP